MKKRKREKVRERERERVRGREREIGRERKRESERKRKKEKARERIKGLLVRAREKELCKRENKRNIEREKYFFF